MTLPVHAALLLLQASGTSSLVPLVIQFGAIALIFYFLLIRPQQKQRKAHEETIQNLKKGDEVVTAGGIVGRVVSVKETFKDGQAVRSMEDLITIESGTSRLVVERGRIARIRGAVATTTTTSTP